MKQGLLGDCWFLCACAALQKSRHLLEQVSATLRFPPALIVLSAVHRKEVGGQASEPLVPWCSTVAASVGRGLRGPDAVSLFPAGVCGVLSVLLCHLLSPWGWGTQSHTRGIKSQTRQPDGKGLARGACAPGVEEASLANWL